MSQEKRIRKFQERILFLEMQLRNLNWNSALGTQEHKERQKKLTDLREVLFLTEQNPLSRVKKPRGPSESKLFQEHWRERSTRLQTVLDMCRRVQKIAEDANSEGGGWRNIFRLSRMRKILGQVQSMETRLDNESRELQKITQALLTLFQQSFSDVSKESLSSLLMLVENLEVDLVQKRNEIIKQDAYLKKRRKEYLVQKEAVETENLYTLLEKRSSYSLSFLNKRGS